MFDDNISIFNDTIMKCKENITYKAAVEMSKRNQMVVLENEIIDVLDNHFDKEAEIKISHESTIEAATKYKGMRTCVLNFASATTPGGGVTIGSNGQEESLCRLSTLYPCLVDAGVENRFYIPHREGLDNIHNDDLIYTPNVLVIKEENASNIMNDVKEPFYIDVISMAAPNFRKPEEYIGGSCYIKKYRVVDEDEILTIFEKRIRRLLEFAKSKKEEVLILGAFGCGAYRNSPRIVATAFKNIIKEYIFDFKIIEFAIYSSNISKKSNYGVFQQTFEKDKLKCDSI